MMQVGDIGILGVATPITRVIFDYNRSCTCVRVNTKYNSYTDEKVMPLKDGCTVWICSKDKRTKSFCFRVFKMRVEDAKLEIQICLNTKSDIERWKDGGEIDTEMEKFLTYALEKLA